LDSEEKLNKRIEELEEDYDELKEKYDGAIGELDDLKNYIIQEHINGFEKVYVKQPFSMRRLILRTQSLMLTRMLLMGGL